MRRSAAEQQTRNAESDRYESSYSAKHERRQERLVTARRWIRGKKTNQKVTLLTWPPLWELSEQYQELQKLGKFGTKTSSWVKTPSDIRELAGALFCDRRYETVFVYHNSAESHYAPGRSELC